MLRRLRKLRFTNTHFVVALFIVVAVLALANGFDLLYRVTYVLVFGILLSFFWAWTNLRGVAVTVERGSDRIQAGASYEERVLVENRSPWPKTGLELYQSTDLPGYPARALLDIASRNHRYWRWQIPCYQRGRFSLGPFTIVGHDPFGAFALEQRTGDVHTLLVYPPTVELAEFSLSGPDLPGEDRLQFRTHHVTPNAASVRDYVFGDSYNRIHWPSTARTGRLLVKEFELDPGSHLWIVLDLAQRVQVGRGGESTEEYAVTIAASIAKKYLAASRAVGLIAYGKPHELVPAERGGRQLLKILEALALVRADGEENLAQVLLTEGRRFGRSSTVVVITPSTEELWVGGLQALMRRGVKAVVVYLDPPSFGGRQDGEAVRANLLAAAVPSYRAEGGQPIWEALSSRGEQLVIPMAFTKERGRSR